MPILPPIHGPRAALRDLKAFMSGRSREQVIGASLAVLSTIIILILFFVDSKINTSPGSLFSVKDRYRHCLRLSCSVPWSPEIDAALRTLGELIKQQL